MEEVPPPATPLDHAEAAALGEAINAALDELGPEVREALELREVEGFSYKEVAERQGITEGTARNRVSRAKRTLRENGVLRAFRPDG